MDVTIYFKKIAKNFSRYHKYTLGSKLRHKSREIVELIIKANSIRERLPLLYDLWQQLEGLKVQHRICKEVKAFHNFNSFIYGANLVIEISRQHEGFMHVAAFLSKGRQNILACF